MKVNKAFKFRIYPNKEQANFINQNIGACRFIYNLMLEDKIKYYEENKKTLNNTPAQYKEKHPWLKDMDAYALCNEQMNLQAAFRNFFRFPGKIGYPKFKSKKNNKASYTTSNVSNLIRVIDAKHIRLPKVPKLRIRIHRQIPNNYKIKSATITRTSSGKYYISILTEYESQIPVIELDKNKALGLDYSSHDFYVDSNNQVANYPKYLRRYERKLAWEQHKLSRMVKGSHNYEKQKIKVAKIHEKIANCRLDFLHKLSTALANQYDIICAEDLNLSSIKRSLKLGKPTSDNGFGMFRQLLTYKLLERGKLFVKIDKWFPSSKTCHNCGVINKDLKLSDRIWICPACGSTIERDYNAALNIRDVGLDLIE